MDPNEPHHPVPLPQPFPQPLGLMSSQQAYFGMSPPTGYRIPAPGYPDGGLNSSYANAGYNGSTSDRTSLSRQDGMTNPDGAPSLLPPSLLGTAPTTPDSTRPSSAQKRLRSDSDIPMERPGPGPSVGLRMSGIVLYDNLGKAQGDISQIITAVTNRITDLQIQNAQLTQSLAEVSATMRDSHGYVDALEKAVADLQLGRGKEVSGRTRKKETDEQDKDIRDAVHTTMQSLLDVRPSRDSDGKMVLILPPPLEEGDARCERAGVMFWNPNWLAPKPMKDSLNARFIQTTVTTIVQNARAQKVETPGRIRTELLDDSSRILASAQQYFSTLVMKYKAQVDEEMKAKVTKKADSSREGGRKHSKVVRRTKQSKPFEEKHKLPAGQIRGLIKKDWMSSEDEGPGKVSPEVWKTKERSVGHCGYQSTGRRRSWRNEHRKPFLNERLHLPPSVKASEDPIAEAESQGWFIETFARPLFELTAAGIPERAEYAAQCNENLELWRLRARVLSSSTSPPADAPLDSVLLARENPHAPSELPEDFLNAFLMTLPTSLLLSAEQCDRPSWPPFCQAYLTAPSCDSASSCASSPVLPSTIPPLSTASSSPSLSPSEISSDAPPSRAISIAGSIVNLGTGNNANSGNAAIHRRIRRAYGRKRAWSPGLRAAPPVLSPGLAASAAAGVSARREMIMVTLLAKAVANQMSATFLRVVGSELIQKYLGDGPKLVHELFRVAEEHAPSIVFI
ncbi:hypothetical protein BV25DRAFT_1921980 [Artomyces pyxidatus]|uniref:Uncharacterized protein n=1 Tax=Artomyces pyxidatus TaxID=48021 RepID=A0ACB8SHJ2_9AGAM|nr:hypothetical protein BV25DRAFT_1921980 [Artomyces pyxidatus]